MRPAHPSNATSKLNSQQRNPTNDMDLDDRILLAQFFSCEFPYAKWCHRLHIRVSYILLSQHSFDEALGRFRAGIRAYNQVHDVPSSLESGCHETLTVA